MKQQLIAALIFAACGCTPQLRTDALAPAADAGMKSDVDAGPSDRDHDGVCDSTELSLGSNPDAIDSDNDGFPDAIELINAFDLIDPSSPGIDQVAFMPAKNGASCELDVRATVDGQGESYTGVMSSYPSFDPMMRVADDFFASAVAVSAEPPENVHEIDAASERFDTVIGHTRLSFKVRFECNSNEDFSCSEGFSFAYQTKTDQGTHQSSRDYMVVITPKNVTGRDPKDFCVPAACL